MAQIIQNKYPIDTEARRAVGFGFPLNGDAVFVPTFQTRDQIKANLVNYLLTNKGERIMIPTFGANLRDFIGEGINEGTDKAIEERIKNNISIEFPQIQVKSVNFNNQADNNTINLFVNYLIRNIGAEDQINIAIQ